MVRLASLDRRRNNRRQRRRRAARVEGQAASPWGDAAGRAGVTLALVLVAGCRSTDAPAVAFLQDGSADAAAREAGAHAFAAEASTRGLHELTYVAITPREQYAQAEAALAAGARVLVVQAPDPALAVDLVRVAHEHGAKVVAYDRPIPSPDLDHVVTHDRYHAGVLLAEAAIAATGGRGRYLVLADADPEVARGRANTLAPYQASGAIRVEVVRDASSLSADAILARDTACAGTSPIAILADPVALARRAAELAAAMLDPTAAGTLTMSIAGAEVPVTTVPVAAITPVTLPTLDVELRRWVPASTLPACNRLATK